ncbi:MAG: hypothetical protein JW763_01005 [candidate division Zixibacteria bacterium]|nr:hypothetical protein [candidate division Zixibacteria bacterium]
MKIAIPIWNNRVSPVMDSAGRLLLIEIDNGAIGARSLIDIPPLHPVQMARFIVDLGIDRLICGAISHRLQMMLTTSGLNVLPWVRGQVDDIITAFINGNLQNQDFYLPGCRRGGHRRGRGCGRRYGMGHGRFYLEES